MGASAAELRFLRCHASLAASGRVSEDVRRALGGLGREDGIPEAMALLESTGLGKREAKAVAVHLARAGPACRKCGGRLEGTGTVRCLRPRALSTLRCDSLNLVW